MVWSFAFLLLINAVVRTGWRQIRTAVVTARTRRLLMAAALLISVNWGVYIWSVNAGFVVEASLGYFINPLVSVALGVVVLGERLRRVQWAAVAVAVLAVITLTVSYGRPPWIALVLASSFALYGLSRKKAGVAAIPALTVETAFQTPFALAYFLVLGLTAPNLTFGDDPTNSALLATAGIATTVPLLLFGAAAIRLPLVALGVLQYLTPVIQFTLGVTVFGEHMPLVRWLGFGLVWIALAIFTVDAVRSARRPPTEPLA